MDILELLAEEPQGLTISAIAGRLGIARSSTHGLIHTLLLRGYLAVDDSRGKRFRLGVRLVQLGMNVADRIDLRSAAHGELERLVARTHETAFLAVPHQGTLINVDMAVSDAREFRTEPRLGARRPLHCSSLGKALLAALDDELVEQIVDRAGMEPATRFSITDKGTLLEDIARTRERGYAVDEHEAVLGICCVGAPVRDHLGRPVGSISIATIADLFQPEVQGAAVLESAVIISSLLGWLGDAKTLYQPVPGSLELLLGPGGGKER